MSVTEAQVLECLRGIVDPGLGKDIVSGQLLTGLVIRDDHVMFAIETDPSRAPEMEVLRDQAEQAVKKLPGVSKVTAVLTAAKEPEPEPHSCGGGHNHGKQAHGYDPSPEVPLMPGVKNIIAVASGKGGVGKSTTSVNLALALQGLGLKVGLFDADIYGPSVPKMLDIHDSPETEDGKTMLPLEKHGLKCMSIGFLMDEDTPVIWRGPMVMGALQQLMRDVQWGELDVMIVDMPPGTGDTQLTMCQSVPLAGAVIVSTPQDIALLDARRGLNMFRKVDVPVLGLIENMSYYHCPNCGHEDHIFGHGGAKAEAVKMSCDFLGEIPLDGTIRHLSDAGTPIVIAQPDSPHAAAYRAIAAKIWDKVKLLHA